MNLDNPYNPGTYMFQVPQSTSSPHHTTHQIPTSNQKKISQNSLQNLKLHQSRGISSRIKSNNINTPFSQSSHYVSPKISRLSSDKQSSSLSEPQMNIKNWINQLLDRAQNQPSFKQFETDRNYISCSSIPANEGQQQQQQQQDKQAIFFKDCKKNQSQQIQQQDEKQQQIEKDSILNKVIRPSRLQMQEGEANSWRISKNNHKKYRILEDIQKYPEQDFKTTSNLNLKENNLDINIKSNSKEKGYFIKDNNNQEDQYYLSKDKENKNTHIPQNLKRRLQIYQSLFKTSTNGFVDFLEKQNHHSKLNFADITHTIQLDKKRNVEEITQKKEKYNKNTMNNTNRERQMHILEFSTIQKEPTQLQLSSKNLHYQDKLFTSVHQKVVIRQPKYDGDGGTIPVDSDKSNQDVGNDDKKINNIEKVGEINKRKSINLITEEGTSTQKIQQQQQYQQSNEQIKSYLNYDPPILPYQQQYSSSYDPHKRTLSLQNKTLKGSHMFKLPKISDSSYLKQPDGILSDRRNSNAQNNNNIFRDFDPWEQDNRSDCSFSEHTKDSSRTII